MTTFHKALLNSIVAIVIFGSFLGWCYYTFSTKPTIKVGVLHSLSGTMAISEKSVADATLMAIDEINQKGGILGRKIEPIVVDGRSDWSYFAKMAEKLITQDKVSVVFGCWTSACRKTVKPIFEKYDHLLIYPIQYEGLESSPNIVYTGAAPNQQIIPAIKWVFNNIGHRFFLVGSDYVFPHSANAIIKDQLKALGAEVVGEEYILLNDNKADTIDAIVNKIIAAKPSIIINTINGDTNVAFFSALRAKGVTHDAIPTISFSIAEAELQSMDMSKMAGDYAAWDYFQSLQSDTNKKFVASYKARYGKDRVTDDPIEAGYFGVYLWAQAVNDAETDDVAAVKQTIKKQTFNAPEGTVYIDPENQHTWKKVRIGKIRPDGQFDIVWTTASPVQPIPYPVYRSKEEWERFINDLYIGWDGNWANPGKK